MADVDTTPEDTACPTDATLRSFSDGELDTVSTDAIAAHLEHCLSCQGQLEQLDSSSAGVQSRFAEPASLAYAEESACGRAVEAVVQRRDRGDATATDRPPERLGEFRLLEPLGAGGMGTVYKARHERLGTISAIKLLHVRQQADERMIERFQREMVALGRLDHPNIVRALDAGEDAGVHYLVMEYVEGADLGAIVQRTGPLSIADACEAARQAALGLAYVHEQGRVHRDVKPSNLMVSSEGQVKLLDLGLARVDEYALDEPSGTTDDLLGAAAELTRTHQVMGTLEYMPPEQAASSKTVTEKADLYALGCTLYKLLAGHPPFGSGQAVTAMSQLMAHVQRPAPPIRESRGDVPAGVARLLEQMLAKRPQDRPESAAEIAAGLAPYARGAQLAALAAPTTVAAGASTVRAVPNTKRISADRGGGAPRRGLSRGQRWTLAAGFLLLLSAAPVGLIGWLYLQTRTGTVIVEADSSEAEQLLQANGSLFFVPAQTSPGTGSSPRARIPVRPGVQELRPGKYVVEQVPPQGQVSPQGPQAVIIPAEFELTRDQQVVVSLGIAETPPGDVAQDGQPKEPGSPPPADPAVDLIALVDPDRDIRRDDWKLVDGALVSRRDRPSAMHIPYRVPDHYRLQATVERVANNESLLLGLVAGGEPAYVAIDSHPYMGARTGMYMIDGVNVGGITMDGVNIGGRSGDIYRGQVLPPGQKVQLAVWVKHLDGQVNIRLEADGRGIFSWRGNVDRLGAGNNYEPNEPTALYLANWTAELRVSDMKLIPLDGEGEAIAFTDPAADPQRAAIERAIWKGARPRVRTDDGPLTILTSLADIRDGMQLVEVSFADNDWVNDNDLLYFASLQTLETLDLSKTAITQDGLERLGPLPNLKRLSLSQLMGEDVMTRAAKLYPSLATLDVSGTQLDGDHLAALQRLPELRELDLSRTAVTAAGLAMLPELPNLKTLNLAGTQVDDLSAIGGEKFPALARLNVLGTAVTTDATEQPMPAAAPPKMHSSDEPVELLDLVDIERDSIAWESTWTRRGDAMRVHPRSRLMLPVHLPQEFDLEMTARALKPNKHTVLNIALPDGTHFTIGFDQSPDNGPTALLHWVDGTSQENSLIQADVSTFPHENSEAVTVRLAVRGQGEEIDIRVFKNGAEILGWQGDRSRLKVTNDWWLGIDPTRPWIGQFGGELEIQQLRVTPVNGELKLPYLPEPTMGTAVVEVHPPVASATDSPRTHTADPLGRELQQRIPGLEVLSGYGPVDVLPLIDAQRDYYGWGPGRWERRNDVFQVGRSRLALPVTLPMEFDIEMTATRRAGNGSPVFALALPDGTRFAVGFDHAPEQGSFTILHSVDGAQGLASPVKKQTVTYPQDSVGPPVTVRVSVRGSGKAIAIRAFKDGEEVLSWEGDRKSLNLTERGWWSGADRKQRPRIGLSDGLFTIHSLTVTPYLGRIGLADLGPSWGTSDRSVAQWVLDHGGSVHVQVDASDSRGQLVQPGETLPKRPFWLTRIGELGGVEIPAEQFLQIGRLQRLEELLINQTSFQNTDLAALAELQSLKVFNAYGSPLDDSGIAAIVALPQLERIAIERTVVTAAGLRGLQNHPALTEYRHAGARTADEIAAILKTVPRIKHIVLAGSDLSGAGLEQLWGLEGLQWLNISNCRRLVDADARQLLGLPNLQVLDIRGSSLTAAALKAVGRLASLETLLMLNQPIGDAGIEHLANLRNLTHLSAWNAGLTDQAVPTIAEFSRMRLLKLGGNSGITDVSVPLLARLDSLQGLDITGTRISQPGLQELHRALPNCRIDSTAPAGVEQLDLRGQIVTDDSLREILGDAAPKKLLIEGAGITDASIAYLASLPGLGELKLYGTSVTNDGLSPLAEAANLYRLELWQMPQIDGRALPHIARIPGLTGIVLKGTGVYGPGLELLHRNRMHSVYTGHALLDGEMLEKYIVPFGTLRGLDLAGSRISDEDVEHIASRMSVTGYLHLGFNPNITGPGLRFIHELPELRTLVLQRSGVDDEGLVHLQGAEHLQNLNLGNTAITDASTDTLITLTGLQTLNLRSTRFTSAGIQRLRGLMPGVKIIADEAAP